MSYSAVKSNEVKRCEIEIGIALRRFRVKKGFGDPFMFQSEKGFLDPFICKVLSVIPY